LDCVMLPKVQDAGQVTALDLLLTQIEKTMGFEAGRIGIEAQIENARGLMNVDEIAAASPRLETIVFGPADFMASINMKSLVVGEQPPGYPADAYHYIMMRILIAARAHDRQAIDGPYLQVRNVRRFCEVARRAAALGFDGKWMLHPDQIAAANEVLPPSQADYDHAVLVLDVSGQAIANLEVESLKHVAPTFHGDTIYGETTVLGKRLTSRGDRGVVEVETRGYKQDGTLVCVFRRKVMVPTDTYVKERGGEQPARPEPDPSSS